MLALTACGDDATPDYRYRLTVEVETPEGLRTGSSVIEVEQTLGGAASAGGLAGQQIYYRTRGEAVAVDLPGGETLFALLRSDNDVEWSARVMQMLAPRTEGEAFEEVFDNVLMIEGEVEVPRTWPANVVLPERSAYPMLVSFADLDDPTSVELVDPDDLEATFGEGYALERITVQLTDEPVTTGIEERLGWLDNLTAYRTDPDNPFTNTLPREIGGLRSK
ncbi:MAG: hypothetical protein WA918_13230 [Erythrobacter sp.]